MPPTYLAGYDGSAESRLAVDLAVELARSEDGEVVAAHVYPFPTAAYWVAVEAMRYSDLEDERRTEAQAVIDALDVEGVTKRLYRADSPARGLHELGEELDARLIAVGATHRGPFGRLAPGSVAMHLLHGASCPVLVTPPDGGGEPIQTVGVAYDGRDESRAALHVAREFADRLGAELIVLGAHQPAVVAAPMAAPVMPDLLEEEERRFEQMLERAASEASASGGHRLLTGPPGHAIAEASAEVDLLVVGSRGYGTIRGVVLGSVSRHLVDHASCPVLVVPRPH